MTDEEFLLAMEARYNALDAPGITLMGYMGMTPAEFADWTSSRTVPERVMRVADRRPVTGQLVLGGKEADDAPG